MPSVKEPNSNALTAMDHCSLVYDGVLDTDCEHTTSYDTRTTALFFYIISYFPLVYQL